MSKSGSIKPFCYGQRPQTASLIKLKKHESRPATSCMKKRDTGFDMLSNLKQTH